MSRMKLFFRNLAWRGYIIGACLLIILGAVFAWDKDTRTSTL